MYRKKNKKTSFHENFNVTLSNGSLNSIQTGKEIKRPEKPLSTYISLLLFFLTNPQNRACARISISNLPFNIIFGRINKVHKIISLL